MEAHISNILTSYVIDPQVYGLDPSIWKTVSGTPTVTSNKYRLNVAEIITYAQYKYGEFEFNLTVPVAPTAADSRTIGLLSKSLGNRTRISFVFNTSGELRAQIYGRKGDLLFNELIPWDTDWTNTAILFRIGWQRNAVKFTISTPTATELYSTTYNAGVESLFGSLNIDISNANADNLDVASVSISNASVANPVNSTDITVTGENSTYNSLQTLGVGEETSYVYDTNSVPVTSNLISTISGGLTATSGRYRVNATAFQFKDQYLYGTYDFFVNIPTVPTSGDARAFGFTAVDTSDPRAGILFNIEDTDFVVFVKTPYGVEDSAALTFDASWAGTEQIFRIAWTPTGVTFTAGVGDAAENSATVNVALDVPVKPTILNENSDNMDAYVIAKDAIRVNVRPLYNDGTAVTSVIPGGGTTSLGKSANFPYVDGETGVLGLGVRNEVQSTLADTSADHSPFATDRFGNQYTNAVSLQAGEDLSVGVTKVEQRFSYNYISTATTTTVKSGAGFLHAITITESVASTIIVYDNTAGSGQIIASFVASAGVATYQLNVSFSTGCTVVTAGASKLTVSYR